MLLGFWGFSASLYDVINKLTASNFHKIYLPCRVWFVNNRHQHNIIRPKQAWKEKCGQHLPLIGFTAPPAYLEPVIRPNPGFPHPVRSTFRFSQPHSGLLITGTHRPYFMPNPLWGFCSSESFPSRRFGMPFDTTITIWALALMYTP